jgi:putative sigma-54 modulation protein
MRLHITARHFKLTEDLKTYTEEEFYRLKIYYEPIIDVDVILSWEKRDRLAEINIGVYGTTLTSHERSDDMRRAIGRCVDKLERQLKRYKERLRYFDHDKIGVGDLSLEEERSEPEEG